MLLGKLLERTGAKIAREHGRIRISGITFDAESVRPGDLFVCLRGSRADGHDFCERAGQLGAAAVLAEQEEDCGIPCAIVADTRKALSLVSQNFYGRPAEKLKIITVVGTNGKTTTAYLIHELLERCGMRSAFIGTMYIEYGGIRYPSSLTTPDPTDLNRLFAELVEKRIEYVVMELSAHAIYYDKLYGIRAEVAVFTNFSRDHLDFFKDMDVYKKVKKSWFTFSNCKCAVINADDPCGAELLSEGKVPSISYGLDSPSDVFAVNIERAPSGTDFVINLMDELIYAETRLFGRFNVYNTLAACSAARLLGAEPKSMEKYLPLIAPPDGRFSLVCEGGVNYVIDFAHTPDGLENLLKAAREITRGKLICVFGCGGDRDATKRPMMGESASRLADRVVVTSDNPRTESRAAIAEDICAGIGEDADLIVILDRETAIRHAVDRAASGDTVVIAGKGSEGYIDENNVKTPYSDKSALENALAARRRIAE